MISHLGHSDAVGPRESTFLYFLTGRSGGRSFHSVRFLRILIPACLTASLAGRLPYTAHEQRGPWRTVGLTVFPVEDRSGLGSAYSPAVALSVCPEYQAGHPTACLLAQA